MSKPTLYLLRGVSGAGKSTLAQNLLSGGVVSRVLEADQYFINATNEYIFSKGALYLAHKWCQVETAKLLADGLSVAVANTSVRKRDVELYKSIAESADANFVSLIVENYHGGVSIHDVPEATLQRQRDSFHVQL